MENISTQINKFFEYYAMLLWDLFTFEFALKFLLLYFFVIWISLIVWVAQDVSSRSSNFFFQFFCVFFMIISTPVGVIVYLMIRPQKTLSIQYHDEIDHDLETLSNIVAERIWQRGSKKYIYCPECHHQVQQNFSICPYCEVPLKASCKSCWKKIRIIWALCPYCWEKNHAVK